MQEIVQHPVKRTIFVTGGIASKLFFYKKKLFKKKTHRIGKHLYMKCEIQNDHRSLQCILSSNHLKE